MRHGLSCSRLALCVVGLATACTSDSGRITGARPSAMAPISRDANPVLQSVTGHWEVIGRSGNLNKISVTALKRLDGTVSGEVEFERFGTHGDSVRAHGTVICLTVDGNTARIGAMGNKPDPNGVTQFGFLTAVDNGEGKQAPPDQGSNLVAPVSEERARLHCEMPPITPPIFNSLRGNIQVRSY